MNVELELYLLYMYTVTLGIERHLCIRPYSSKQINFRDYHMKKFYDIMMCLWYDIFGFLD